MKKRFVKALSLIFAVALIFSLINFGTMIAKAAYSFSGGDGSQGNPYLVSTATDFANIVLTSTGNGTYYKLTSDLTISQQLGDNANSFNGVFDGNGHTITVNISNNNSFCTGLFANITSGEVKNLIVTGSVTNSNSGSASVGAIAGMMQSGIIDNCISTASVNSTSNDFTGDIVGTMQARSLVDNSYATGTVTNGKYVGGIAGVVYTTTPSTINNCYAANTVSGNFVGAFASWSEASDVTLSGYYDSDINGAGVSATSVGNYTGTVTGMTSAAMKASAFVDTLNNGRGSYAQWTAITNGFPTLTLNTQAAPSGQAGVAPSTSGGSDGKITGTTTLMEYKLSSSSTWTPVSGTQITGLIAGDYDIRFASKTGFGASSNNVVTVPLASAGNSSGSSTSSSSAANPNTGSANESLVYLIFAISVSVLLNTVVVRKIIKQQSK